jgi:hypothetical protein
VTGGWSWHIPPADRGDGFRGGIVERDTFFSGGNRCHFKMDAHRAAARWAFDSLPIIK